MPKTSKHYLASGKEYKGAIHKMSRKMHTGAKHSSASKTITHNKSKKK